jgi:hypothetical protein
LSNRILALALLRLETATSSRYSDILEAGEVDNALQNHSNSNAGSSNGNNAGANAPVVNVVNGHQTPPEASTSTPTPRYLIHAYT